MKEATAIQRQHNRQAAGMSECIACGGSGVSSRGGTCKSCKGAGADIAQHSSASVEHYTPAPVVDAARSTLGAIDLDPASCTLANDVVKATAWYGPGSPLGEDGLKEPWGGRVFLNPPGGRVSDEWKGMGTTSNAALWWSVLASKWASGEVEAAIFIGFTLEILRSAQALDVPQPLDFPICVPSSRIAFDTVEIGPVTNIQRRIPSTSPTHANVIVFLPPVIAGTEPCVGTISPKHVHNFQEHFGSIGRCRL